MSECGPWGKPPRKNQKRIIDFETVRSLLDYDHENGILIWKERQPESDRHIKSWNAKNAGKLAGYIKNYTFQSPQHLVKINGVDYNSARIAYIHFHAVRLTSSDIIRFMDGNNLNLKIYNLKISSPSERNFLSDRLSKSGMPRGVCYLPQNTINQYSASVSVDGKKLYIGSFLTPELAYEAYAKKREELQQATKELAE